MKKTTSIALILVVGAAAAAAYLTRASWSGGNSSAQAPPRVRVVAVELAKAERKPVPVEVDSIGMVTPISSVALKSRVETTILAVHFEDGARVKEGDLLFTLDSRQIDAQIEQAEGTLMKDRDTTPLAIINQMAPVYVSFAIPQRVLADLREAMAAGSTKVIATIPQSGRSEDGTVAMVENSVDSTTGMVTVRGIMNNPSETLWPGILVQTKLIVRTEDGVVVPTVAVQRSQTGNFVFTVKDNVAHVQPVTVDRTARGMSVISSGLTGTEDVVVDGQLLLTEGTRVEARARKAGA